MKHVNTKTEMDKAVILAVVRKFGPLSRMDIAERTRLRLSTISLLTRELIKEDRIREAGTSNNPLGRKQVLLELNEDYGFVIGLDLDPDFITAGVLNLKPRILGSVTEETPLDRGREGLISRLISCVREAMDKAGLAQAKPLGVVFGDAGIVDSEAGRTVHCSEIDFWHDVPLREIFQAEFDCHFLLESNTRCRTVAERVAGAGEGADDMIYIDYRAGIGAGIVSDGRMLRGSRRNAGEFGHTHVIEDGPPCKCGSFGCLDSLVGATAVGARARRAVEQGGSSSVLGLAGGIDKITGWNVLEAASRGDKMCMSILEDVAMHLGLGIANLVNLFNPAVVVLSPRLRAGGQRLLDQITWVVQRQALHYSTEKLVFRYGTLGDEAGILGAGHIVLDRLFEIPALRPPKYLVEESVGETGSDLSILPVFK